MIGIMTAAGKGTRLRKLTGKSLPKALLKINEKPMIAYGIEEMIQMGVSKIYIVGLKEYEKDFKELLNKYKILDFCWMEKSDHIMDSLDFLSQHVLKDPKYDGTNAIYWLADNVFIGDDHKRALKKMDSEMSNNKPSTGLLLVETETPQDFITMKRDGSFEEKPKNPETNLSAVGVFLVNSEALSDTSKRVMNEGAKEYTIWDSWMQYHTLFSEKITDVWVDVGTPERYFYIQKFIDEL